MSEGTAAKQARLPGAPGPDSKRLAVREDIADAMALLHKALFPILEELPPDGKITFSQSIRGDRMTVTVVPAENTD